ncbi:MAG: DUF1648 domain-containing protein [Anaerotardibacter sp.]
MNGTDVFVGVLIAMIPVCGILLAITPWLMPKQECFAVTIPESAARDSRLRGYKRTYAAIQLLVTVVFTLFALMVVPETLTNDDSLGFTFYYLAAVLVPMALSFALMLFFRKKVNAVKEQENWKATTSESVAFIGKQATDIPRPLSLTWNVLYIPIFLLSAVLIMTFYPQMPQQLPMQAGFNGEITSWVEKSYVTACFPLFVEVFIAVIMIISHWMIDRSKKVIDPSRPATSAFAYGAYAHAYSVYLLATGLLINFSLGVFFVLAEAGIISLFEAATFLMVPIALILGGALVLAVVYGQSGARIFAGLESQSEIARDDDAYWKLGVFYVNRNDSSFIVTKRFGFGWTINWANPKGWFIIGLMVVITVVFCGVVFALF